MLPVILSALNIFDIAPRRERRRESSLLPFLLDSVITVVAILVEAVDLQCVAV